MKYYAESQRREAPWNSECGMTLGTPPIFLVYIWVTKKMGEGAERQIIADREKWKIGR
jgi:hypothetical protein